MLILFPPPQFFIIFLPQCFLFPFITILIFSLNFIIFPPQCYYSLLYNFIILVNLYRISMQEDPHYYAGNPN